MNTHAPMRAARQGFTLIEMSVVLVIIGFIIGGIVAGQSMIRQSQVTSAATAVSTYIAAMQSFQQKYSAKPGDMANAISYWGIAGGTAGTNYTTDCYSVQGTGTLTCNGNGNGQIADGVISGTNTYADEAFRAWQQMGASGFVQGSYTGVAGGAGASDGIPGTNIPQSNVANAGFMIAWFGVLSGNASYYDGIYNHVLELSGRNGTAGTLTTPVLSVSEAQSLDTKFDDGQPGYGNILAPKTALLPNCTATATGYAVTGSSRPLCFLIFKTGF